MFIAFEFKNQSGLNRAYNELFGKLGKLGEVELNQDYARNTAIITNAVFQKRVGLMNVMFAQKQPGQFILYICVKRLKN